MPELAAAVVGGGKEGFRREEYQYILLRTNIQPNKLEILRDTCVNKDDGARAVIYVFYMFAMYLICINFSRRWTIERRNVFFTFAATVYTYE